MQPKTYLARYQVRLNASGSPLELRRSANALVYKGVDASGEDVALEVFSTANLSLSLRQKLEVEAKTAKRLDHINIPVLHDFGFDGDETVYVTEYFEGTTAEDWVKSHGPLPTGTMLRIALQAISALGAAAFHSIFHYAINPRNIMLVPGQTPQGDWPLIKMLHFTGLAPALTTSAAAAIDPAAPVRFASPEQLQSGEVDFRSEMYSLGCLLWYLLTGEAPHAGAATVETATGMSGPVKRLLSQMLAVDPNERPLDPLALQKQVSDCLAHLERLQSVASKFGLAAPSSTTPIQAAATPQPVIRRGRPMKRLALAALLLGLGVLAAFILPERIRSKDNLAASDRDAIGIPIGVPENSGPDLTPDATAPEARQTAAPAAPPSSALANTSDAGSSAPATSVAPLRSEAPVVAKNAGAPPAAAPVASPPLDPISNAPAAVTDNQSDLSVVASIVEPPPAQESETSAQSANSDDAKQSARVVENTSTEEAPGVPSQSPSPLDPVSDAPAAVTDNDSDPPVVVSIVEPPPAPESETSSQSADTDAGQVPQVAENAPASSAPPVEPVPVRETASPEIATSSAAEAAEPEPEPPFEGPVDVAASAPSAAPAEEESFSGTENTNAVAQSSDDDRDSEPAATTTSKTGKRKLVTASKEKKNASAKRKVASKKTKGSAEKTRIASAAAADRPPLPRGAVRAEFLGTTADGNLIFGLPSSQRGYVAAPPAGRDGSSRRRTHRVLTEPAPAEVLPILPALPPNE